jgi:hypothetical protein
MIVLDSTKSLVAKLNNNVETNQPQFYVSYADSDSNILFKEGSNVGTLNGVDEVILLGHPSSAQRVIKLVTICNMDTKPVEVNISILENNTNRYSIVKNFILQVGRTLIFNNEISVLNPNEHIGSSPIDPINTGTVAVDNLIINPTDSGTGSGKIYLQGTGNVNKFTFFYNESDNSIDFIYNIDS